MIRNAADSVEPIVTQHGVLRLRRETDADATFLSTLHETVKGAELAPMPVPEPVRRHLLDMQFRAMTAGYHAMFPDGRFEVITLSQAPIGDEAPIGRLITDDAQGWFHIVHIALLPKWRNRGISNVLMASVLDTPRRLGWRCEATVAADNLASRRLWSRLGFSERAGPGVDLTVEWLPS